MLRRYADAIAAPSASRARPVLAALCAAVAAFAVLASPASAVRRPGTQGQGADPRPFLDVRAAQRAAAERRGEDRLRPPLRALRRSLGRQAVVEVDALTGTPEVIARLDGTLTGPRRGDRREIAERWVREHLAELGLDRGDLGTLRLEGREAGAGGVLSFRWRQYVDGVPALDSGLTVHVTRDGRVLGAGGAPQPDLALTTTTPALGAADALRRLMDDVGVRRAGRSSEDTAELVAFADGSGPARLAWRLLYHATSQAVYDAVVDAASGRVLVRANLVRNALVWENHPGAPAGGTQQPVDLSAYLDPGAIELAGPNARVWSDLNDDNAANGGETIPPGDYAFTPFTHPEGRCTEGPQCSWNVEQIPPASNPGPPSWEMNRRQNAVQAFWFANRYHDHLKAAPIGFAEFEGASRLRVQTDDGAGLLTTGPDSDGVPPTDPGEPNDDHTNNANMFTPSSGAPTMQLYLFFFNGPQSPFRDVNGGDDAAIVYHEYTHGLSDRLVSRAARTTAALSPAQGGAMGEGWSDWYAKDFLVQEFPSEDTPAAGEVDMGDYIDAIAHSIRTQALDCPVGAPGTVCENPQPGDSRFAGPGGYTYGDFGRIAFNQAGTGPGAEVHADGEIWAETLWDLRNALGPEVARAIVTQGMRLVTAPPSFLAMRDAIILADRGIFGAGHHYETLWRVFATRGMGFNASTDGPSDTTPTQGFDMPPNVLPTGTLSAAPAAAAPGQAIQFSAAMSDSDGGIVAYEWDFDGNGSIDRTTAEPATAFAYAGPGQFTAQVAARDTRDGRGTATAAVSVATAPPPSVAPKLTLAGSGRLFRVRYVVDCDSRCTGTAKLTITKRLAKRLKLRSRTVGSARFTLPAAGRRTARLTLSFKTRRSMRRAKVRRIAATFRVVATDAEAQRAIGRRAARIRSG